MLRLHGSPLPGGCTCCGGIVALQAEITPFAVDPQEAIDFLRRKVDIPTNAWTDLWQQEHSAGFTVAGATTDGLVKEFHAAVDKAVAQGTTIEEFRRDFDRIVAEHGWSYNGSRNWRSRVIFDTNMNTAYAAGKWEQIQRVKKQRPYLRYVHLEGQKNPRPLHQSWHGIVLPVDHPWWKTHYPPNGWFCHCTVQSLNDRDLKRYGYMVSDDAPPSNLVEHIVNGRVIKVPEGIDPGFAYRPGEMPASFVE